MEMQTLKDGSNPVFVVTDLLRGVRYFVADNGSHYEIQVPRKGGYIRVAVSREADVIDIADKLIRSLDTAKNVCFTPHASVRSSSPSLVRTHSRSLATVVISLWWWGPLVRPTTT